MSVTNPCGHTWPGHQWCQCCIYNGELDYPAVHRLAPERLKLIHHGGNPLSKQLVATGADHHFSDNGEELIKEVSDWLDSLDP